VPLVGSRRGVGLIPSIGSAPYLPCHEAEHSDCELDHNGHEARQGTSRSHRNVGFVVKRMATKDQVFALQRRKWTRSRLTPELSHRLQHTTTNDNTLSWSYASAW